MRITNAQNYMRQKYDERGRTVFYNDPIKVIMTCKKCSQEVECSLLNYNIKHSETYQVKMGCKKCGGEN